MSQPVILKWHEIIQCKNQARNKRRIMIIKLLITELGPTVFVYMLYYAENIWKMVWTHANAKNVTKPWKIWVRKNILKKVVNAAITDVTWTNSSKSFKGWVHLCVKASAFITHKWIGAALTNELNLPSPK